MKNTPVVVAVVVALLVIGGYVFLNQRAAVLLPGAALPQDYKDGTYVVNGAPVTLSGGVSETQAAPGSASRVVTKYFGNDAEGDLNGDGVPDVAFLLTQDGGGSGTFYYVAAALKTPNGYQGTDAVLLGDRIAPQTTEVRDGEIIVNYADRAPNEPMSVRPSVGVSGHFKIVGGQLVAVDQ